MSSSFQAELFTLITRFLNSFKDQCFKLIPKSKKSDIGSSEGQEQSIQMVPTNRSQQSSDEAKSLIIAPNNGDAQVVADQV